MITYSIVFYLAILVACIGAGYLMWTFVLQRLMFDSKTCPYPTRSELGVVGMFGISMFAVLLNYIVPISHTLSVIVIGTCFIAGIVNLIGAPNPSIYKLAVLTGVVALFAVWGSKFMLSYDAGLYHLQAIQWIKEEPIVVGLANIHDRFGFNSIWFSALAVFWLPYYEIKGVLLGSYVPAIFLVFILSNHILDLPKSKDKSLTISTLFALFCLTSLCAVPFLILTTTTSTDLAPNVLTLLSAFIFLRGFEGQKQSISEVTKVHMMLWVIALFAILTKLSAVTPSLLALTYTLYNKNSLSIIAIRRTFYFFIIVTGAWVLRNFLLSGCLIFPVGFTCADANLIEWSVGADNAEKISTAIVSWAKSPGEGFLLEGADPHWFDKWLDIPNRGQQTVSIIRGVLGMSAVMLMYLALLFTSQKNTSAEPDSPKHRPLIGAVFVLLSTLTGLIFGFVTVPDPRHWSGSLIAVLILPPIIIAFRFFRHSNLVNPMAIFVVILLITISTSTYVFMQDPLPNDVIKSENNQRQIIPEVKTELVKLPNLVMYRPLEDDKCWLAPMPCSPSYPPGLTQYRFGPYSVFTKH